MKIYYNEFNKKKCASLYALMQDGYIRKGDIDDRPIQDVQPDDVRGDGIVPQVAAQFIQAFKGE